MKNKFSGKHKRTSPSVRVAVMRCLFLFLFVGIFSACTNSNPDKIFQQSTSVISKEHNIDTNNENNEKFESNVSEKSNSEHEPSQNTVWEQDELSVIPYANSYFEVHYIDVGQADAALVLCDDKAMLIDGGNVDDGRIIVSYLKKHNIDYLDYIISTHAHEDHVGGLSAALATTEVGKIYAPKTGQDTQAFWDFLAKTKARGLMLTAPVAGDSIPFGSSQIQFLGPVTEDVEIINNTSIVLKITYGNTSFLFTGDAEREEELSILDAGYDLSADVLKVGHHGSDSSTSYVFLRKIMPKYAVISVGQDNSYKHPSEDVLSRLRDANVELYRTDIQGDIVVKSNGEAISISTAKNNQAETNPTKQQESSHYQFSDSSIPKTEEKQEVVLKESQEESIIFYIGNRNSQKFHYPDCPSIEKMKESNKVILNDTRSNVIAKGYNPCGNCNP